jgi:hypothetical protein
VTPIEAARDQLERLRRSPRARILFVTHAFGGGVARHIDELGAALAADAELLLLQPIHRSWVVLRRLHAGEELAVFMHTATEWQALVGLLESLGIDRVHFHHVHGLPREVLELPGRLGCAHDLTLHDYFPACPQYHLRDGKGRYCGADPRCRRCLETGPAQWPLSVDAWRAAFGPLLATAGRLIAPSHDSAERIRAFFPEVAPLVWPHAQEESGARAAPARVLVPGAISPAKGLEVLEACVRDAQARSLPLHFRVLGYIASEIAHWPQLPFSLSGEYPDGRLPELLALEGGDVVFFPAQCPETFSYTLSEALDLPLPIVATDLGALPERLAGRRGVRIVPWDAPAAAINDALLAAAPRAAAHEAPSPRVSFDDYRARYLAPIRAAAPRRDLPLPPLEERWLEIPADDKDPATLEGLFDDGVRCGRASSLEELRRRAHQADAWIAQAVEEIHRQQARLAQREDELARARDEAVRQAERAAAAEVRLRLLEGSRSWKITAPLRAVLRWLGRGAGV